MGTRNIMLLKASAFVLITVWLLTSIKLPKHWWPYFPQASPKVNSKYDSQSKAIFLSTPSRGTEDRILVELGLILPSDATASVCEEGNECYDYGVAKLVITSEGDCDKIEWTTNTLGELKDCVNVLDGHWYGGGAQFEEPWPVEKVPRAESPHVTGDTLQNRTHYYGGVIEHYWVSSLGVSVRVENEVPLFFSLPDNDGNGVGDQLCFSARFEMPFVRRSENAPLKLAYQLCYAANVRKVYDLSYKQYFSAPRGIPDERMFTHPIWSTWAQFHTEVSSLKTINMAQTIKGETFSNSQIEIDDDWETCYGDAEFNPEKFPSPKEMVDTLHAMGFRVTLWVHPFINTNCKSFIEADNKGYFLKNEAGRTQLTHWWQGKSAGLIDFTNPAAVDWWSRRLEKLRMEAGIDSFKFDAGEVSWMPENYTLSVDRTHWPLGFTTSFIGAISKFGPMLEARVGHNTQSAPIFIRMLDKFSDWSTENGLLTLIPSLLHQGLLGYPFVLPDMVGGNAYNEKPSEELFIRWAQANTFMPAMQFSLLPWDFVQTGNEVTEISLEVAKLHAEFAPLIVELARNATLGDGPIARPTWWLCPLDENCLTADQQFLLGDDLLVTPVVYKGATTVDVVFPPGKWKQSENGKIFEGPSKKTISGITIYSNIYFRRLV